MTDRSDPDTPLARTPRVPFLASAAPHHRARCTVPLTASRRVVRTAKVALSVSGRREKLHADMGVRGPKTGFSRRMGKKGRKGHTRQGVGWMAGVEAKNAPADPPPAAAAPPRRRRMSGTSGVCRPREPLVLSTAPKAVATNVAGLWLSAPRWVI